MAAMDRTNFLAWRTIDIVHGGAYSFATDIATANSPSSRGTSANVRKGVGSAEAAARHSSPPGPVTYASRAARRTRSNACSSSASFATDTGAASTSRAMPAAWAATTSSAARVARVASES